MLTKWGSAGPNPGSHPQLGTGRPCGHDSAARAYVADVSIHDINEVYEIRTALETLAAGLAAERIEDSEIEEMDKYLIATRTYVSRLDYAKIVEMDTLSMMSSIRPAAINAA